jgi:hypothetical protein
MRTAILLSIDSKGAVDVIAGPDYAKARETFDKLTLSGLPKGAELVELWTSSGGRKRIKAHPKPAKPDKA